MLAAGIERCERDRAKPETERMMELFKASTPVVSRCGENVYEFRFCFCDRWFHEDVVRDAVREFVRIEPGTSLVGDVRVHRSGGFPRWINVHFRVQKMPIATKEE